MPKSEPRGRATLRSTQGKRFLTRPWLLSLSLVTVVVAMLYGFSRYPGLLPECLAPSKPVQRASAGILPGKAIHKELRMAHHHVNKPGNVHTPNTERDACLILPGCYPDATGIYADVPTCHRSLNSLMTWLDSSTLLHGEKIVGFISFHRQQSRLPAGTRHVLLIYNVCVHPEYRGRGLATRLLEEGLEEMIDHYKLRGEQRLLLGLDVDLSSPMAAESFSLYGKLGFLRGWQPCRSVGDVDWRTMYFEDYNKPGEKQNNREIIVPEAIRHPLDRILWTPSQYDKDELRGGKPSPRLRSNSGTSSDAAYDHFCMFKWYGESWLAMGQYIAAPFRKPSPPPPSV